MSDNVRMTITMRDLSRNPKAVADGLRRSRQSAVLTHRGRPLATLTPIDEDEWEDYLLGEIARRLPPLTAAERRRSRPLADVAADLGLVQRRGVWARARS